MGNSEARTPQGFAGWLGSSRLPVIEKSLPASWFVYAPAHDVFRMVELGLRSDNCDWLTLFSELRCCTKKSLYDKYR